MNSLLKKINFDLKSKNIFISSIIDYKNNSSRCKVTCKEHGNAWEWGNPWIPSIQQLKSGFNCPKCIGNYRKTEAEIILEINTILKKTSLSLISIINYKNVESRTIVHCKEHGNSSLWANPWNPKIKDLKSNKHSCPKCAGNYQPTKEEIINEVNSTLKNEKQTYFIKDIPNYKNSQSRCIMTCSIHGDSDSWEKHWTPTIAKVKAGRGCTKCSNELGDLHKLLKADLKESLQSFTNLYFVKFKFKNNHFYKVGITNRTLELRFPKTRLEKSGLSIVESNIYYLPSFLALTAEKFLLNNYQNFNKRQDILNEIGLGGATECFNSELKININDVIKETKNSFKTILSNAKLNINISNQKFTKIINHFNYS